MKFLRNLREKFIENRVDRLVRMILKSEGEISPWVIDNLSEYSQEEITSALKEAFPSLESYLQKQFLFVLDEIGYIKMLLEKLDRGSEEDILFSLDMLSILKPIRALGPIIKKLADSRETIRFEAADTLIAYRHKKVVDLLVKELREDSPCLPARVAQVLYEYGSLAALILMENLQNPKLSTHMLIEILAYIKDDRATSKVLECINSPDYRTRAAVIKYLNELNDPKYLSFLKKALEDESFIVINQAIKGLKRLDNVLNELMEQEKKEAAATDEK
jgi:HEAT repeat protein